jgi:ABC-2 type transport system ATP-binding protein
MPSSQPVISAVSLSKTFHDFWHRTRVWAVRDIDLEVAPGEIYGLLGPNGSGKSTTIKMILGLLHATRGRVAVFGQPPDNVPIKRRIGYLPEESYLYRFLNARETLDYYGTLFQLSRRERQRRTEELLEMVGLKSVARRPVGEYSKGMARRIGLAQALINDPDLLILDEPTSGLDPIGAKLVKDIIVRLGKVHKKTILLSSHLLADVEEVCTRVTILYGGRIRVAGHIEDVLTKNDVTQMTAERLRPETVTRIRALVDQLEHKQLEITTPRDRLEELFLRIVREAAAQRTETAGAAESGAIAGFLGADEGRSVLQSLVEPVAPEAAAEPAETLAAETPDAADQQRVLSELTEPQPPAPEHETEEQASPATPPAEAVDHSVIADLTGGAPDRGDNPEDTNRR